MLISLPGNIAAHRSNCTRPYDENGDKLVWLVLKALYGSITASRQWFNYLRTWLIMKGYTPCHADPCIYVKKTVDGIIMIAVYVDDLLFAYSDVNEYQRTVRDLVADFDYDDLGPLTEYLGTEVRVDDKAVTVTLSNYIEKTAEQYLTPAELVLL